MRNLTIACSGRASADFARRLSAGVLGHQAMQEILIPNKCLQFGKGSDLNYDAVCFDWSRRLHGGDCPVVQIDHEEILCHYRFKKVAELAPSFRELMMRVIATAAR